MLNEINNDNTNSNTVTNSTINKENSTNLIETKNNIDASNSNTTIEENEIIEEEIIDEEFIEEENTEEIKELSFIAPVSGEIIKDYAVDSLIYSKTLEEWTTHNGIDIKADKMSIVVAAEEGVVESIKNDPRYGLTVTISHENGFKTIYSNLLTTEFVKEGDAVEKGETIATVGESASFEVADESHLHFEMYKDGELVNPTIYLK